MLTVAIVDRTVTLLGWEKDVDLKGQRHRWSRGTWTLTFVSRMKHTSSPFFVDHEIYCLLWGTTMYGRTMQLRTVDELIEDCTL